MRTLTHIFNKILAECCYIILVITMFCVTWQAIARFIFNAPNTTLDEFTQVLFMWMVLLGSIYITGLKKHLAIDLLAQRLLVASVLTLGSLIQIIITVSTTTFVIYGGNTAIEEARHVEQISPALKWPVDKVYWVMPINGLILVWYSVIDIIDNYRKRNSH